MGQELAHHNEQLKLQQDIEEALDRARRHVATDDDISLLSWASGIQHKQEKRDGKDR